MVEGMNPVGWFEIPVEDLDRARRFYETVFEIEMPLHEMGSAQMAWFPMVEGAPGAAGALMKAEGYVPSGTGIEIYFTAPDMEETLERAAKNGGEVLMGRTGIGEYGFIARFRDTEGNHIAIHSRY
jgi:predicted enzyme related to lactoylglutathione lyase